jgi:Na+/H+ antiporter NhaD/arsenite permease-like protein
LSRPVPCKDIDPVSRPAAIQEHLAPVSDNSPPAVVMLHGGVFLGACAIAAGLLFLFGRHGGVGPWLIGLEVMATILGLFAFGSFKYQIHKNALTYGMALVVVATFCALPTSPWHAEVAAVGWRGWAGRHLLSFEGLDEIVHADTMLFILGLTFFVSVIAQTRLLEAITFFLLRRAGGAILPTVVSVTAVVALASGIFDGVSMIGLTIRTLMIVLLLGAATVQEARYAVMVCTLVTTICGVWMAYGEPPNLIMRANLFPHLNDLFFLRYCAPIAIVSYAVVWRRLRRRLGGRRIDLTRMDVIDANAGDVRFLQAMRHGEVFTTVEVVQNHAQDLGRKAPAVLERLRSGESLGIALVRESVPEPARKKLLAHFASEELADGLDRHYVLEAAGDHEAATAAERDVDKAIGTLAILRRNAVRMGALAVVPFVALLVLHGVNHKVPLFLASVFGFLAAMPAILTIPRMRRLAMREARQEYAEYYFLFPLFLSITLLTQAGFFAELQTFVHRGIDTLGVGHVAVGQFMGSALLSAILDNNIVADFASRALNDLDVTIMHLFAMAQIAGYAVGGCWTHIGSAQSVVAFAFIRREVDEQFTPVGWMKEITPVVGEILAVVTVVIYAESALLGWLR